MTKNKYQHFASKIEKAKNLNDYFTFLHKRGSYKIDKLKRFERAQHELRLALCKKCLLKYSSKGFFQCIFSRKLVRHIFHQNRIFLGESLTFIIEGRKSGEKILN
jgi:hypothetical protein